MHNTREKLIELLCKTTCRGDGESLGSCPDRKFGMCGEVSNLSYCVIQNIANHLIANGATFYEYDCHWATEQAYKNGYEQGKKDALKWIPVSEPPKENGYYLCWILVSAVGEHKKYRQKILFWEYNLWLADARGYKTEYPMYWMPLPEPPKGE